VANDDCRNNRCGRPFINALTDSATCFSNPFLLSKKAARRI
jgi:hypothetical protein